MTNNKPFNSVDKKTGVGQGRVETSVSAGAGNPQRNGVIMPVENAKTEVLKIAVIIRQFPTISETFVLNQIIELKKSRLDIDIMAMEKCEDVSGVHQKIINHEYFEDVKYIGPIPQNRFFRTLRVLKIIFRNFARRPAVLVKCLNFKKYGAYQAINRLILAEHFLGKNYGIVYCQFATYANDLIFLKEIMSIKFVTAFRGFDISRHIKIHGKNIYNTLFRQGDAFLPVCRHFQKRLEELGCPQDKIHVVYSGINLDEFAYHEREFDLTKRVNLLTAGRLVEKKGTKYLLLAFSEVLKRFNRVYLTVIGQGEKEEELKGMVDQLGLSDNVRFVRHVIDNEMKEYYYHSDIFVLPCVTAEDGDQEGIPNVLKEAMATGMPVISTKHSGIPELISDKREGFVIPERDVGVLVRKIEYLIDNPPECRQMGVNGRATVEQKFDARKINLQLGRILQTLCTFQS